VGSLREGAIEGRVDIGSLMAGQSVGLVKKVQPLREILVELVEGADRALEQVEQRLSGGTVAGQA
jgi:enoyl-[acyl-carrier protein] reductase II